MAFGPGVGRDLPGDTDEPERTSLPKQVIRQCTFPSPPSLGDTSAPSCPVDRRWAERRACRGSSRINSTMTATDLEQRNANLVGGGTSALHQQLIFRPIPGSGRAGTPIKALSWDPRPSTQGAGCTERAVRTPPGRRCNIVGSPVAAADPPNPPARLGWTRRASERNVQHGRRQRHLQWWQRTR